MKTKWLLCPICGNKTRLQIRRLKEVAAMKHIPYRQNPTVIDISKKSPTTAGKNSTHEYELSNHLNTSFNTHTPVRAFRTGVFCCSKNFLKKIRKSSAFFSKGSIAPRKGESTTNFPTRKGGGGRMWNLIAGSL